MGTKSKINKNCIKFKRKFNKHFFQIEIDIKQKIEQNESISTFINEIHQEIELIKNEIDETELLNEKTKNSIISINKNLQQEKGRESELQTQRINTENMIK